jgi:HD-GYP domain-containing protein (c-di-GMP phosphodiesterase class II)
VLVGGRQDHRELLAAADAFEAMTGDRVYRTAMPVDDAIAELRLHAGTQFDETVVEALIASLTELQDAGGGTRTPTALTTRT